MASAAVAGPDDFPADMFVAFFPPPPPVYGAALVEPPPPLMKSRAWQKAPEDLADYVGEVFYPMLGARIAAKRLSADLERQLHAYRRQRAALLTTITNVLVSHENSPPAERLAALQGLAREQTAAVVALEAEAERLRRELMRGGLFSVTANWLDSRRWRLGDPSVSRPPFQADAEHHIIRAVAYYQDGLTLGQRGLLREMAMEWLRGARPGVAQRFGYDNDLTAIFLAPETARLRLPPNLPAELVTKIGRFNREKATLKEELMAAVRAADQGGDGRRTSLFTKLAEKQAPALASLELLAEEIRQGLAAVRQAPAPWMPPIPAEVSAEIEAYNRDRAAFIAELRVAMRQQIPRSDAPARVTTKETVTADGAQVQMRIVQRELVSSSQIQIEFLRDQRERVAALHARYEKLRARLGELAREIVEPRTGQPMTEQSLLEAYRVSADYYDALGRREVSYVNYKAAMLEPGFSPPQRRLLFNAAQAGLAQPLPEAFIWGIYATLR